MEDSYVTQAEHKEFVKRVEAANSRYDKRLEELDKKTNEISDLTISVAKLAQSVETMCKTQERQNTRLEALESRDGEMWRKVVAYIVTAIVGIVVGYLFTQIGM